jgi:transposase
MEIQPTLKDFEPRDANYWSKYNRAKCNEKRMFYILLDELCAIIPEPVHHIGRKPIPLRDLLFCACLKIYSNYSARKISSDMKHAADAGFVGRVPHFNSLLAFMNNSFTEEMLKRLITISAMPLKELETDFAMDSSGFGMYQHNRWSITRWSKKGGKGYRDFVKCHICVGTKTNVITAAEVTYGTLSDHDQLPNLVKPTSANFDAKRYSADKAYCSKKNFQLIGSLEAFPFIPFKKNVKYRSKDAPMWNHMFVYFSENREKFKRFYHRRSNVESTFSMIKMRLGEYLKCKNFQGQKNEVLLKCLVHNICCLVQEIFESGVKIDFRFCDSRYSCT